MTIQPSKSIGLIIGSMRKPRVGSQFATLINDTINAAPLHGVSITTIDLSEWNLPLFDEPGIPSQIKSSAGYEHEHTKKWSEEISRYDAFIFVTPQYNWGYPAGLKNAIDYLFNEWKGKPAMIASYGGHGGGKAAEQLKQVLQGVRMRTVETMPAFMLGDDVRKAAVGAPLDLQKWEGEKEMVRKAFGELVTLLIEKQ